MHTSKPWKAIMGPHKKWEIWDGAMEEVIAEVPDETPEDKYNVHLMATAPDLLAACEITAALPDEVQEIMRREGFVIDDLDDRWQKFAFTLYTMIAENASNANAAIAKARGDT